MKNEFKFGVSGCARCAGTHEELVAKPFTNPIKDDNGAILSTHFSVCPSTNEPILVLSIQKAK
jgi:hypothetical protein